MCCLALEQNIRQRLFRSFYARRLWLREKQSLTLLLKRIITNQVVRLLCSESEPYLACNRGKPKYLNIVQMIQGNSVPDEPNCMPLWQVSIFC